MKFENYNFKSIILGAILLAIGGFFQINHYYKNLNLINQYSQESLLSYGQFLNYKFITLDNVFRAYQLEYSKRTNFDPKYHEEVAKNLLIHVDEVLAFNFVDKNHVIRYVYPSGPNIKALNKDLKEHSDPIIQNLAKTGFSKDKRTILPPVSIYQGGEAIIFYYPISFQNGEHGWLNIVIKTNNLFGNLINSEYKYNANFALYHSDSKRFYFKSGDLSEENFWLTRKFELLDLETTLVLDLKKQINELRFEVLKQFVGIIVLILLSVFMFRNFLKSKYELYEKYIDVYNEGNLLRALIHDLGSPLTGLQMILLPTDQHTELNNSELKMASKLAISMNELVTTIREMLLAKFDKGKTYEIDLEEMLDNLIMQSKELVENGNFRIVRNYEVKTITTFAPTKIFKNHILNNVLVNSLKHAIKDSVIQIKISRNQISITNASEKLDELFINHINEIRPMTLEIGERKSTGGMGLGLFITKIFCRQFKIKFKFSQNPNDQLTTSQLSF